MSYYLSLIRIIPKLQECCVNRGIKKSGVKADLIIRLENYEKEKISQQKITSNATILESQLAQINIDTESFVKQLQLMLVKI
jgi:hypothetical protein